jgi:hypothetical protein
MNRTDLTARYLEEIRRNGARPRELIGTQPESELLNGYYHGRYLARPLFLGHDERDRLYADLANLRGALVSLPDRLFGGDLGAFARAVGMTDIQISAIERSRGASVTQQTRADLYLDDTGFKLLEFNMGSALAGMDNADMCRALLEHPLLAQLAQTYRLGYVDTMREQVHNVFVETGFEPATFPVLAITDWPSSFPTLEPYMRQYARRYRELGIDAYVCHIGQLEVRDRGIWLGDRRVDIVDRLFMIEDLLESPDAPALMDPVLDAAARGDVKVFTPLDSNLFASKGALAMLSDEDNRRLLDPDQLASLDRILPWTRMVRPGPVTLEKGRRVDLLDYALTHQQDLALKPTLLHGGQGVLLGWHKDTTPQIWEEQIRGALGGPYVIQRRVRPVPELFPTDDGDLAPWIVAWGVFTVVNGFGGVFARATTVESNIEVINVGSGAYAGCCLYTEPLASQEDPGRSPDSS